MNCELISVGTEILTGAILNTNARWLSEELSGMGLNVRRQTSVGDNPERLEESLRAALSSADLVILTGGLGPTQDDLTKETTAKVFNRALQLHPEIEKELRAWFSARGYEMTENNLSQAMFPEGCTILPIPTERRRACLLKAWTAGAVTKPFFCCPDLPEK